MRKVVLGHDSRDLPEVVQDGQAGVFNCLLGRAKLPKVVFVVEGSRRSCQAASKENIS